MAKTTRQTAIFGVEDWKRLYQTFREADFQSYDFETLRKSFVDYLRLYYPETFNDYIESSEFIALLDVMAFMGQALAFRNDLNARENFLDTAERRDSVVRLANLVSYTPKRNSPAQGYLKVFSISTTENLTDFNGINLSNVTVNWNDVTNANWFEQFTLIVNAALVDSQKYGRPANSATILGVRTDEYSINLVPGFLPIVSYSATVDGVTMPFEAVSSTSAGRDYVYEPAPRPSGQFNILYRNDRAGFGSANTGFFFLFKQGVLQNQDFNLAEALPNRNVNINIEGSNQEDHWLFKLDNLGSVAQEWEFSENIYAGAVEQLPPEQRQLYSIRSRTNDQITLTFGDGVFSEIPVGLFRVYVRASNGLEYIINPEEMQSVPLQITYVSRIGRVETLTLTCGITTPVSNAQARETIAEIKQRAPARYYTQNRMVNGEDYNNFPFTQFNSIIKSKAVARSAVGASRYVDLTDVTGRYSSTNIFASDGVIYRENQLPTLDFEWINLNEIVDVINNSVEPLVASRGLQQFYYANFPRPDLSLSGLTWQQSTRITNETTGYFTNTLFNRIQAIGSTATPPEKYLDVGSLILFQAPTGQYFDRDFNLRVGVPQRADDQLRVWASIQALVGDGTANGAGNLPTGAGPVTLNQPIPTGAVALEVIPRFINDLPPAIEQAMIQQIELFRNFGLGYASTDITTPQGVLIPAGTWYIITSTNLALDAAWSQTFAGDTSGANLDNSWLLQFDTDGETYTVTNRSLLYFWASVIETRFTFDGSELIYDTRTGSVIRDFIRALKTNNRPDSSLPLGSDITMDITDQPIESDGYVNDYLVTVSYRDSDSDGVPDNPDFFDDLVAPRVDPANKLVFFQLTTDADDIEQYLPLASGVVNSRYETLSQIELVKSEFLGGQVFYARAEDRFYQLVVTQGVSTVSRTIVPTDQYRSRVGRQDLYFQYRHNSSLTNVIDPGVTNIIDLYVVNQQYYTEYQNYIRDTTGTVAEPTVPTIAELTTAYSGLNDYKMVSDNIVLNSVMFKPLFGAKAAPELRATIKVVRAARTTASVAEIKSQVVANLNQYFSIDKWDFGDSFFFSELAAYLHEQMGSIISSAVIVPLNPLQTFGDLYEIRSAPNEIFVNAATVADVEVIEALTQSNIRSQTPVSGLYPTALSQTGEY